jgi:SPP1 family predicted phage head-tail adaptor
MYHSINAGRLRDYVELFVPSNETDEHGQVTGKIRVFEARAEVRVVSGDKIQAYGTITTGTIITVLMWYDVKAANNQVLIHKGVEYSVDHIKPDDTYKSMILTCSVIKK